MYMKVVYIVYVHEGSLQLNSNEDNTAPLTESTIMHYENKTALVNNTLATYLERNSKT